MECAHIRESISALLDGEDPGLLEPAIAAHLDGCGPCTRWTADADALHRLTRVRTAEPVPDLSATIVAAALPVPGARWGRAAAAPAARSRRGLGEVISGWRWALFAVALTQLVLAGPAVLLGDSSGATVHTARELGAFDVALAIGLLVAAWQPARAWGLLPVAAALGLILAGTAVLDVVDGSTSTLSEAHHLLDLAGVALLSMVAREHRVQAIEQPPGAAARWSHA